MGYEVEESEIEELRTKIMFVQEICRFVLKLEESGVSDPSGADLARELIHFLGEGTE